MDFSDFINNSKIQFSRFYTNSRIQIALILQPNTTIYQIDKFIIKFNEDCNTIITSFNEQFKKFNNLAIQLQSLHLSFLLDVLSYKNQIIVTCSELKSDIIDIELKKLTLLQLQISVYNTE